MDNVARAMTEAASYARARSIALGIEAVNRYENHLINTAAQAVALIERIGLDNLRPFPSHFGVSNADTPPPGAIFS